GLHVLTRAITTTERTAGFGIKLSVDERLRLGALPVESIVGRKQSGSYQEAVQQSGRSVDGPKMTMNSEV
ncbi:hypothetical protein, partial [Mesorhizobium sp.]